jgi:hypothetical protein
MRKDTKARVLIFLEPASSAFDNLLARVRERIAVKPNVNAVARTDPNGLAVAQYVGFAR